MQDWVAILIVAVFAGILTLLSTLHVKRVRVFTDQFARAFCQAYDHVLPAIDITETLRYETMDGGVIRVLPASEQPEPIRGLLEHGVDGYIMDCLREMYTQRDQAQALLTSVNLIEKKYNAVLNHCYDLANLFYSFVADPSKLTTKEDYNVFSAYLNKQSFLRNTTLPSIISDACRKEIVGS